MSIVANFDINLRGITEGIDKATDGTDKKVAALRASVEKSATGISSAFKSAGAGVQAALAAATAGLSLVIGGIAAVGSAFVGMGMGAREGIDALAKGADKIGMTTEALAGLQHAADLSGVESDTLDKSLVKMQKNLAEAASGGGELGKTFAQLGLNVEEMKSQAADQSFLQIADAINKVGDQSERISVAMDIFGKSGADLLNVMKDGSNGLAEAMKEAGDLGLAVSRQQAAEVEEANDAMSRIKSAFTGLSRTAAITIAPFVKMIADAIVEVMKYLNQFRPQILEFARNAEFVFKNFGAYAELYFTKAKLQMVTWANDLVNIFTAVVPEAFRQFPNVAGASFDHVVNLIAYAMAKVVNLVQHVFSEVLPTIFSSFKDLAKAAILGDSDAINEIMKKVGEKMASRTEGPIERMLKEDVKRSGEMLDRALTPIMEKFKRPKGELEAALEDKVANLQGNLDARRNKFIQDKKADMNIESKKDGPIGGKEEKPKYNSAIERGSVEAFKFIYDMRGNDMLKVANQQLKEQQHMVKLLERGDRKAGGGAKVGKARL